MTPTLGVIVNHAEDFAKTKDIQKLAEWRKTGKWISLPNQEVLNFGKKIV